MGLHPVVKQGSRAFGAAKLQTCGNPLVHVIQKDTFLPSSTVHDVIHRSRILYAQRPQHAATVPNPITTSSALIAPLLRGANLWLTPFTACGVVRGGVSLLCLGQELGRSNKCFDHFILQRVSLILGGYNCE